jgi:hypothetical protein
MVFFMADLISQSEENSREKAREEGRKDEHEMQRQRNLATDKGRKEILEAEHVRGNRSEGIGTGLKFIFFLIVLAIIIVIAGFLTLSVSVTDVTPGMNLPFTSTYGVVFSEGQTIAIGNTHINVLSFQNEIISDIDGDRQKLVVGEKREISERRAVITTLGIITLVDTNFKIDLTYKGNRDNRVYFDMAVHTSRQVPDMLLKQLLPPEINAQPI